MRGSRYNKEKLLFRRQYALGPHFLEDFHGWKRIRGGPHLCLTVHPDLPVSQASRGGLSLLLIGYMLDPFRPLDQDSDILERLLRHLEEGGTRESLIQRTEFLGGRWVLVAAGGGSPWLFHDPCGYRPVFHTTGATSPVWCASQPGILAEVLGLSGDREAWRSFRMHKRRDPQYSWPGQTTLFREIRHLQPNHYLDLRTGESRRYWPVGDLAPRDPEEVVEENARLLQAMIESASHRFELALTLTAGRDTRTLLAASKALRDRLFVFTLMYWNLNWNSRDISVPSRLLSKLGIAHHVIVCPSRMDKEFCQIWRRHVVTAHDTYGPIVQAQYEGYPQERACMQGIGMPIIMVPYLRRLNRWKPEGDPENPDPNLLAWLGYWRDDFSRKALARWLADVPRTNLRTLDLFYWEEREGGWTAMTLAESDLVQESFVPYNCRLFLKNGLSLPRSFRSWPNYTQHEALMRRMWLEVLTEPFNPPDEPTRIGAAILSLSRLKQKIRTHPPSSMGTGIVTAYQRHPWLTALDRLPSRAPHNRPSTTRAN
jgi:hypothetical protein